MMRPEMPAWFRHGACRGHPSEMWFPTTRDLAPAIAICRTCPVQSKCLRWALDNDEQYGVWGGFSARGRARMKAELR